MCRKSFFNINNFESHLISKRDYSVKSHHVSKKPETETEDLRLFLSRKRPRNMEDDDSSTDDQEPSRKAVRSVVVVPK